MTFPSSFAFAAEDVESSHFHSSERAEASQSESRLRKLIKEGVGQEWREPRERELSVPTPLPLTPLIPPSLAHSGLEMRSRGGDILAYTIHGTADFIAIRIHYETKIRSTPNNKPQDEVRIWNGQGGEELLTRFLQKHRLVCKNPALVPSHAVPEIV